MLGEPRLLRQPGLIRSVLVAGILLPAIPAAHAGGEIYGTIATTAGETLRGPIRWDRNEVFWDDLLDATRREPIEKVEGKREFNFSIFGLRLGGPREEFTQHGLSIPFGHLRSLESVSDQEARLVLKRGKQVLVHSRSTDIGQSLREVIIDDRERGAVSLDWSSIRRVEFVQGPDPGRDGERLFGKVVTADGTLEGFIVFDRGESLAGDPLTGRSAGARKQIRLGDVSVLEPTGGSSARIVAGAPAAGFALEELNGGSGHRSVTVTVGGVGSVEIDWDDIRRIDFARPPASPRYDTFDGGRVLSGTVFPRNGKPVAGEIIWDRDESSTYDAVDGETGVLDYAIPFANIHAIKRKSARSSEIVLTQGASLELSGTNDVSDDNRGVIVRLADGTTRELEWDEIDRVEFHASTPATSGS